MWWLQFLVRGNRQNYQFKFLTWGEVIFSKSSEKQEGKVISLYSYKKVSERYIPKFCEMERDDVLGASYLTKLRCKFTYRGRIKTGQLMKLLEPKMGFFFHIFKPRCFPLLLLGCLLCCHLLGCCLLGCLCGLLGSLLLCPLVFF